MTTYTKISTTDLINAWNTYGADSSLVVYMDKPHQVQSITTTSTDVQVVTDRDTFVIPRSDKSTRMWRVLG